jgi:hypothetical protein
VDLQTLNAAVLVLLCALSLSRPSIQMADLQSRSLDSAVDVFRINAGVIYLRSFVQPSCQLFFSFKRTADSLPLTMWMLWAVARLHHSIQSITLGLL